MLKRNTDPNSGLIYDYGMPEDNARVQAALAALDPSVGDHLPAEDNPAAYREGRAAAVAGSCRLRRFTWYDIGYGEEEPGCDLAEAVTARMTE
jgi:hypothetical protein